MQSVLVQMRATYGHTIFGMLCDIRMPSAAPRRMHYVHVHEVLLTIFNVCYRVMTLSGSKILHV
jgi:hypothetical protein